VALVGNGGRNDLVHGRGIELCRFPCADHRSGDFVRDRARCDDGFRHMGSLHLERIRQCTSECAKANTVDVHFFSRGVGRSRGGASICEVTLR